MDDRHASSIPGPPLAGVVLVTGALGLVGRDLTRRLLQSGCNVRGVDRALPDRSIPREVEMLTGDLCDPSVCRAACSGVGAIVHTAAEQYHSCPPRWVRTRFFDRNAAMARALTHAARSAGVRAMVMLSSDMVYGRQPRGPVPETALPRPIGPYGVSKLTAEEICGAARDRGVAVTILRPRLIIGPGRLGVLRLLFDRIRAGRSIYTIGRGANRYQMVSVADVSSACLLALQRPLNEVFNLGSSDPPPVRELLAELCRRARSASRIVRLPALPARAALTGLDWLRVAPLTPEQFRIADADCVLDTRSAGERLGWIARDRDIDMLWQAYQSYVGAPSASAIRTRSASDVTPAPRGESSPLLTRE